MRRRLRIEFLELRHMLAADPFLFDANQVDWEKNYDLEFTDWQNELVANAAENFIPTDIERDIDGIERWGTTFQRIRTVFEDYSWWIEHFDTLGAFESEIADRTADGFRLVDQEMVVGNSPMYSGLWVKNNNGRPRETRSFRDVGDDLVDVRIEELEMQNFLPIDIEVHGNGDSYSGIWVDKNHSTFRPDWRQHLRMDESNFLLRLDEYRNNFRLLDFESYIDSGTGEQRYAAIWIQNDPDRKWAFDYDLTLEQWRDHLAELETRGFRLIDYETYFHADGGRRYAGVWRQNGSLPDDRFEQNDEFNSATNLTFDSNSMWQEMGLIQCDDDYYSFQLTEDSDVQIDVLFSHAEGDINLELLDSNEDVIATSASMTDNESYQSSSPLAAGEYALRIHGPNFASEYDLKITVTSDPNESPIADVSKSRNMGIVNKPIVLDGTRSTDPEGEPLTYEWSIVQEPPGSNASIDDTTAAVTFFTTDTPSDMYRIQLVVSDGEKSSEPKRFLVDVLGNVVPTPNVSLSQSRGSIGSPIKMDGSRSSDPQGDSLNYHWSIIDQPTGSNPVVTNPDAQVTTWTTDMAGTYRVRLAVDDGPHTSDPIHYLVNVSASTPPTGNVSMSISYGMQGQPVILNAMGSSDAGGNPLTYRWSIVDQPVGSNPIIANQTASVTTWTADMPGTYRVELVVNNGVEDSFPVHFLTKIASAVAPIADVSKSLNNGTVNSLVALDGSRSTDPNALPLTYDWSVMRQPIGSNFSITNPSAAVTTFSGDTAGQYRIRLVVNNGTEDSLPVMFVITLT